MTSACRGDGVDRRADARRGLATTPFPYVAILGYALVWHTANAMGIVMSVLTGVFLGLLGLVIVGFAASRLLRVARTPTTPIAKSPGGGIAEIKGRAVPGPSGTITAPVSGVEALWVRIDVSGTREESDGKGGRSTTTVDLVSASSAGWFLAEDGSGECARIEPARAEFDVRTTKTVKGISESVAQFLGAHGVGVPDRERGPFHVRELVITSDALLYLLGPSSRDTKPDAMGVANRLVMESTFGDNLLVSDRSEGSLVARQIVGIVIGAVITVLGAMVIVMGTRSM